MPAPPSTSPPPSEVHSQLIPQFPDVRAKLQKPARKSAFDKQKADAEAKRQREAEETAAVYQEFIKSFQRDEDDHDNNSELGLDRVSRPGRNPLARGIPSAPQRLRARDTAASASRPMSPPPRNTTRSRAQEPSQRPIPAAFLDSDDECDQYDIDPGVSFHDGRSLYGDETSKHLASRSSRVNDCYSRRGICPTEDSREPLSGGPSRAQEKAISKPTLRLANLPPGTSISKLKALVAPLLAVDNVRVWPPQPLGPDAERRSATAIVTLSKDTPATEIDSAVSALQHRYLGFGYRLSLHRHLSSAVASAVSHATGTSSTSTAFGAKTLTAGAGVVPAGPVSVLETHRSRGARGHPPPATYGAPPLSTPILYVPVRPPFDINRIRLIHRVLEGILTHGPEFEALLMSRPEVQSEERWAWLWDARCEDGVWYRWRLWEIVTSFGSRLTHARYHPVFENSHSWRSPETTLPFQHTTSVDELHSDPDYDPENDVDLDEDSAPHRYETEMPFLNPLGRAKLVHFLSRLPGNIIRLRKGDVARITAFAIKKASCGAEEIVDIVTWNVEKPFVLCSGDGIGYARVGWGDPLNGGDDVGTRSLVGLYVISDILSCSATSGIRHAWRYRQLLENALTRRGVFNYLGTMPERLGWGRLRIDKWKRSVGLVLDLWEGWCVFPAPTQESFAQSFQNPARYVQRDMKAPLSKAQGGGEVQHNKWKIIEESDSGTLGAATSSSGNRGHCETPHKGTANTLIPGARRRLLEDGGFDATSPRTESSHPKRARVLVNEIDGEPMSEGSDDGPDLDGEPMSEDEVETEPKAQ